jgi:2-aminoethylphosphonate-pyruvate transaminase
MHILLNPGPVNVSPRVRAALNGPDLCHRESEYSDLQDAIRERLPRVFGASPERYTSVLLTGSGTAIVEAMITSCVPPGGRLLVVMNGEYGRRIGRIATAHGIASDTVASPWIEPLIRENIEHALDAATYDAIAMVHHETTTGLLNDVGTVADLVHARGARLLVDAVSALGGERVDFERWRPDAVACTANECIQGLPGLSFALVRRDFMEAMAHSPARTLYLHLPLHHAEQEKRSTPFTPAVQIGYALLAALDELAEETVAGRMARYARAAAIIRDGLETLGFALLLPAVSRSNTLTAAFLPVGVRYGALRDALKRDGFVIDAGQDAFASTVFRVANMGHVEEREFHRFVQVLGAAVA